MKVFLTIALTISSLVGFSQEHCRAVFSAKENIDYLKNGVLLVRLSTRPIGIKSLKDRGFDEEAEALRIEQREENLSIYRAFTQGFDFCPVMFFFDTDSQNILNGDYANIQFLGPKLEVDPELRLTNTDFLVAEKVNLKGSNSTGIGFNAVIIKDQCFKELDRPFPYYSKSSFLFFKLSDNAIVSRLSEKLTKKHRDWNGL